jgi:hypothetical protein
VLADMVSPMVEGLAVYRVGVLKEVMLQPVVDWAAKGPHNCPWSPPASYQWVSLPYRWSQRSLGHHGVLLSESA